MADHPINLVVRFFLEVAALVAMGRWGWRQGEGAMAYLLAIGIPGVAALVWGVFRVPDDPGPAPIAIPGILRLALEGVYFAFAVWALYTSDARFLAWLAGGLILVHYLISYDRLARLLASPGMNQ